MKKLFNETYRMQKLAGVINESLLNEYGMTHLEDEDIEDVKDIVSLLRQAIEKCNNVEMEDLAFTLEKYANDIEQSLESLLKR